MPRISHLQLQRRRTDRVSVFFGGEYAFSLLLDLAVRLKVDQDISDAEIAVLQAEDSYRTGLDRALRWIALRPRSRLDVERYLADRDIADRDVPPDIAPRVLARLTELEYLDDRAFAQWWVDNRSAKRPRGRQVLRHELSTHGIAPEIIAAVTGDVDEPSAAVALALTQARRYRTADRATFNRRLGSYLSRRGFGYGAVREALVAAWQAVADGVDLDDVDVALDGDQTANDGTREDEEQGDWDG